MKYSDFPQCGFRLSKLAFGCAPVIARVGRRTSLRAMECAFDLGVTHFDVARSYGYGDAEAILGQFATGRRDRITIATKFGIRPARMATPLRMARPFLRRVIHHLPGVRRLVRRSSPHSEKHGFYNLDDARLSLERSLRQLRTDYLDCLFIQDCSPSDPLTDELFDFLKGLVANGKIRAWGYATRRQWLSDICRRNSNQPMILQHEQSLFDTTLIGAGIDSIPAIYHSPFGGPESGRRIAQAAATLSGSTEPEFRRLTVRLSKPKARSRFLLEAALLMSGDRPVLCSMFDLKHIRENVAAVNEPHFIPEHVAHMRNLLDQTIA